MGAPFAFKHLRNIKTPQTGFSPDKSLTNGGNSGVGREKGIGKTGHSLVLLGDVSICVEVGTICHRRALGFVSSLLVTMSLPSQVARG